MPRSRKSRKASHKSPRKSSRKSPRKSPRRKSKSPRRKSPRKSPRKSSHRKSSRRKSPRKSSHRKSPRKSPRKLGAFAKYVKKYSNCCKENVKSGMEPCVGNVMRGAASFYRTNDLSDCSAISKPAAQPTFLQSLFGITPSEPVIPEAPTVPSSDDMVPLLVGEAGKNIKSLKCRSLSQKNCDTRDDCAFDTQMNACRDRADYEKAVQRRQKRSQQEEPVDYGFSLFEEKEVVPQAPELSVSGMAKGGAYLGKKVKDLKCRALSGKNCTTRKDCGLDDAGVCRNINEFVYDYEYDNSDKPTTNPIQGYANKLRIVYSKPGFYPQLYKQEADGTVTKKYKGEFTNYNDANVYEVKFDDGYTYKITLAGAKQKVHVYCMNNTFGTYEGDYSFVKKFLNEKLTVYQPPTMKDYFIGSASY